MLAPAPASKHSSVAQAPATAIHPTATGRLAAPHERPSLLQLVLAAEVALALLLLLLARSARFVAFRVPSLAVVGRAAPAFLTSAFYLSGAVGVSCIVLLVVG